MGQLNDWHEENWKRMHDVFAPAHNSEALLVCIGEEIGELCAAVLGVTGEKKRKAHLTAADVRDACADAATYLSLLVHSLSMTLDEVVLKGDAYDRWIVSSATGAKALVTRAQEKLGGCCYALRINPRLCASYAASLWVILESLALRFGCDDWHRLLGDTFNMVSDRAGSSIKTTLGQT